MKPIAKLSILKVNRLGLVKQSVPSLIAVYSITQQSNRGSFVQFQRV